MIPDVDGDADRIEELTAIIHTVRDRVRSRYPQPQDANTETPGIRVAVADLMPLVHARDAAQAKIASIGSVNPRAGGIANKGIQFVKKSLARALRWFVRDQVTFNRETISALEAAIEALNDHNRSLVSVAAQTNQQLGYVRAEMAARVAELSTQIDARAAESSPLFDDLRGQIDVLQTDLRQTRSDLHRLHGENTELKDIRKHWTEWRADWERKLGLNEIQFLRSAADLQGAFQHRVTLVEAGFRETVKAQHNDYLGALDRANIDIQQRLWRDLEKIRADYERLIHIELRLIRQRAPVAAPPPPAPSATPPQPRDTVDFDYARFAERFRGSDDYVRHNLQFYRPFFAPCTNVLDIGCGRGEFLETMRDMNVRAKGIDLSEESVSQCRLKDLDAEVADLFAYLAAQPDAAFDGIVTSQVVEHLPPARLPEMMRLCAAKLNRGGILAVETPNPECLAIFATHFYLDPTHTRPVPHPLLSFYMEEAGFATELHRLSPAIESFPELGELPPGFREKFFGGLDYTIVGRRL